MSRACSDCEKPIGVRNASGKCRSCFVKAQHRDPIWKARQHASLLASCSRPESRAKKSAAAQKVYADPAMRARMSEAKKAAMADPVKRANVARTAAETLRQWHATTDRDWSAWHHEQWARRNAWCPADRHDELKALTRKVGSTEARRMIEADLAQIERRRLAALDPLERQIERLNAGARLVATPNTRRSDPAFTIGGIATAAL